jgi:hypothetical protein
MTTEKKIDVLRDAIAERISVIQTRVADNRQRGFRLKLLITGLSALTTVLLGLKGFSELVGTVVQNVALITSALVSLFAAWDAFFNYRAIWLRFQATLGQLKELEKDLRYQTAEGGQPLDDAKLDELYGRYRQIMSEHNASWLQLRRVGEPQGPTG